MEIKVLGTGCSSCKALYETTKQAISELGCDATLIKEANGRSGLLPDWLPESLPASVLPSSNARPVR